MGSSVSAIADDENDWDALKKAGGIDTFEITRRWNVYSRQAYHTKKGYLEGIRGALLVAYVQTYISIDALLAEYRTTADILQKAEKITEGMRG